MCHSPGKWLLTDTVLPLDTNLKYKVINMLAYFTSYACTTGLLIMVTFQPKVPTLEFVLVRMVICN